MTRGRWITPDTIPAETICRVLFIPNDTEIRASVNGAISELIFPSNWEQVGAVTPAEMAAAMDTMFWDYVVSECGATMEVDLFTNEASPTTAGGGVVAGTPQQLFFQTVAALNAGNVSVAGTLFTIQPGTYLIEMEQIGRCAAASLWVTWLELATPGTMIARGLTGNPPSNVQFLNRLRTIQQFAVATGVDFWIRSSVTRATDALGVPHNFAGFNNVYGSVTFTRLGD